MSIRRFFSPRATRVFSVRYERKEGFPKMSNGQPHFREITVPVGHGWFRLGSERAALELAERRLKEQYGPYPRYQEVGRDADDEPIEELVFDGVPVIDGVARPDLTQDNYEFVSITRA